MKFFIIIFCGCAIAQAGFAQELSISDSVMPIMENVEKMPPQKYSERHYAEIQEALKRDAEKVRVVSYNILFDLFDAQLVDKTHSWESRLPRVVASIKNMAPDLLCLQEVYPKQLEDLRSHLGAEFAFVVGDSKTGELNVIGYRKERFESVSSTSLTMPFNPKDEALVARIPDLLPPELEPGKQLTLAHFLDKLTGKHVVALNTHLTFYRVNSREDQVRFIADLISQLQAEQEVVILTGDFNTLPNRPDLSFPRFYDGTHLEQIFQSVVKDTREVALLGSMGPLSTFTKDFSKAGSHPFEGTGTPGFILDHIYVSKEIEVIAHATEASRVDGHFPSDHMPIVADILLP
jgi:endonuclease/exonuclease/phosphatase family metal-dependent hydrolase